MLTRSRSLESYERAASSIWHPGRESSDGSLDPRELVRCATLAASSHNTQPWKFRIHGNTITILPDFGRRCPAVDPDDSHLFKSLGCAAENLVHAAAAQGHAAHVHFDAPTDALVVQLERSSSVRASALFHAIPTRQCVRLPYNGKALDAPKLAQLEAASTEGEVRPVVLTSRDHMERMLEYVREGNVVQFNDPAFVRELRDWARYNPPEALRKGDGLAGVVAGQPSVPTWLGKLVFGMVASGRKQADIDAINLRSSAGMVVFVGPRDDKATWIETGRAYERFALQGATWGVRNAFINQPVEVRSLRPELLSWLGLQGKHVHLIARFGEGPTVPHSLRRPLDEVIL